MKICLFSHYSEEEYIPNSVLYYLEKLNEIVDQVIVLTNKRHITNLNILSNLKIGYHLYPNSGYDFGMYYKFLTNNIIHCDQLYLVNDSMILFNDLTEIDKWVNDNKEIDMLSLTDSVEVSHHLQSFFLVLNKETQTEFISYLNKNKIKDKFLDVIHTYEVGFSTYLLRNGYKLLTKYSNKIYTTSGKTNSVIYYPIKLIDDKLPMIKRKLLFNTFHGEDKRFLESINFNFKVNYWDKILENKENNLNINYIKNK